MPFLKLLYWEYDIEIWGGKAPLTIVLSVLHLELFNTFV
jgi:hypothetical protein